MPRPPPGPTLFPYTTLFRSLGGRVDGRFTQDVATGARAELGLRRLLPGLAGARIERAWGGPIDVSADHLPFFGTVPGTWIHRSEEHTSELQSHVNLVCRLLL